MSRHLEHELDRLKERILKLSAEVEETVRRSVRAVEKRDGRLAESVIDSDSLVDEAEIEVEEECLKILALHQPLANDLRLIVAVIKINNDLERIGDLAVNIAERARFLSAQPPVEIPFDFAGMAEKTQRMLRESLDALVRRDDALATAVIAADAEIDRINREMYGQVRRGIREHPERLESYIHLLAVSRHLERIADHATNIAEDVIYMIRGEIVRHHPEKFA